MGRSGPLIMVEQFTLTQLFFFTMMILIFGAFLFLLSKVRKRLLDLLNKCQQEVESLKQQQGRLNKQFIELRSIASGLSKKTTNQNELVEELQERIVLLENVDSDGRFYSRANKMVLMGANVDELIEECELPKAEAELMISLQSKVSGKNSASSFKDKG